MRYHNFKSKVFRILSACLILITVFGTMSVNAQNVQLDESIRKGDYIQWGTLSGNPLIWVATCDSASYQDVAVEVMTRDIVTMMPYHDENYVPASFDNSSIYKWLNSNSGFWSSNNFSESDRYIRAEDYFAIMTRSQAMEAFSTGDLSNIAVARYNGGNESWWIAPDGNEGVQEKKGYIMNTTGQIVDYPFSDVSQSYAGVRPTTMLNLESFYIASGNGSASSPYIIRSVYNQNVKNIKVSGCALTPSFNPATTAYSSTVTSNVEEITIEPQTEDPNATVTISRNGQPIGQPGAASYTVPLEYGQNNIVVSVLAVDGFTEVTYTMNITRQEPENTLFVSSIQVFEENPRLELKLDPAFDEKENNFTIDVGKSIDTARIAVKCSPNAKVEISLDGDDQQEIGAPNEKGEYEDTFVVDPDLRLITLTVTSENEKENKKFVINVKHGEFAIYANAIDNSGLMSSSQKPSSLPPSSLASVDGDDDDNTGLPWWAITLFIILGAAALGFAVYGTVLIINKQKQKKEAEIPPYMLDKDGNPKNNEDIDKKLPSYNEPKRIDTPADMDKTQAFTAPVGYDNNEDIDNDIDQSDDQTRIIDAVDFQEQDDNLNDNQEIEVPFGYPKPIIHPAQSFNQPIEDDEQLASDVSDLPYIQPEPIINPIEQKTEANIDGGLSDIDSSTAEIPTVQPQKIYDNRPDEFISEDISALTEDTKEDNKPFKLNFDPDIKLPGEKENDADADQIDENGIIIKENKPFTLNFDADKEINMQNSSSEQQDDSINIYSTSEIQNEQWKNDDINKE